MIKGALAPGLVLRDFGDFNTGINMLSTIFMPHGHCYQWQPGLMWLHVVSDSLIALSYFSIPILLVIFATKRKNAAFHKMLILFGLFICLCGITHLFEVYNVWNSAYWIAGFAKVATALISMATALVLAKSLPQALSIPLPLEYRRVEQRLQSESQERQQVMVRLQDRVDEQNKQLWESDSRWRFLTEFIYSAVWLTDENGKVNQALPSWEKFTGQTFKDYHGAGWINAYLESDRNALMAEWKRCTREECNLEFEAHLWCAEAQKYKPVLTKGAPFRSQNGKLLEWMGAIWDLSEMKQQEITLASYSRRLQAKNQYLQELAHMASHDLREPLRKIQAYGDILQEDFEFELSKEGQAHIQVMQKAAKRMNVLIDDLFDYSRASSGDLRIKRVDLKSLVNTVLEDLEVSISEAEAVVEYGNLSEVDADELQLQRVLQNLLGNAVKYRVKDRRPRIRISASKVSLDSLEIKNDTMISSFYHEILISDNGIGIDSRHLEKIFKPFLRLHGRTEYSGTGIGLAICQRVVERHNGLITVESELGKGSCFKIYLPVL